MQPGRVYPSPSQITPAILSTARTTALEAPRSLLKSISILALHSPSIPTPTPSPLTAAVIMSASESGKGSKPKSKEKKSKGSGGGAQKTERLKTVVRRLPPNLPEEIFWQSVAQWVSEETVSWKAYYPGKFKTRYVHTFRRWVLGMGAVKRGGGGCEDEKAD